MHGSTQNEHFLSMKLRPDFSEEADLLLESDYVYFELGAKNAQGPVAVHSFMPEFRDLPAACVWHRLPADVDVLALARLLPRMEAYHKKLSVSFLRLYTPFPVASAVEKLLQEARFQRRVETGYRFKVTPPAVPSGLRFHPVCTASDWKQKTDLQALDNKQADGHAVSATRYVAMEREKTRSGKLHFYLCYDGLSCIGSVGWMELGTLVRFKNLYIHSTFRRQRYATRVVSGLIEMAAARQMHTIGCFALDGEAGEGIYKGLQFDPVVKQIEWMKTLD